MSAATGGAEDRHPFGSDGARFATALKGADRRGCNGGEFTYLARFEGRGPCEYAVDSRARDRTASSFATKRCSCAGGRALRLQREGSRRERGVWTGAGVAEPASRRFARTASAA